MKDRVFDKLIILIVQTVFVFFLIGNSDNAVIFDIMLSVVILIITELFRNNAVAIIAMAFSAILTFFYNQFVVVIPVAVYSLCSSDFYSKSFNCILDYYYVYSHKVNKNANRKIEELTFDKSAGFIINMIILSVVFFVIHENAVQTVISIVAMAMALRTDRALFNREGIEKKFYSSRQQMYSIKKKNDEALQQADENIYMATLEERNRIAREIHDNVGHMLTRAIVQMQALKVVDKDENAKPLIDSVDETINQAMLNIRRSVHELHDDSIDISIMTNELLKTLPDRFTVNCKTSIESAMGAELKNAILAILKESITNIIKYSKGDQVKVEIIEHTAFWRLCIFDNGENEVREYDSYYRDNEDGGIGLVNIYSRVKKLGGRVSIQSGKEGFTILATINK